MMFGLGLMELLVLLTVGLFALGGPIALIVVLVVVLRNRTSTIADQTIQQLQEENQRLRDELATRKANGPAL